MTIAISTEPTLLAQLVFGLYVLVIIAGGCMAVFSQSLVRAMVGLILTLFGVAGMYLLLNTAFVALMQLLIYVGAVVILIFFAIMLTRAPTGSEEEAKHSPRQIFFALIAGLFPACILALVCFKANLETTGSPVSISIQRLGQGLMEDYILAFELISVVLLIAMAGAVLLGFEKRKGQ